MDGAPLPREHGFPARLIVPGLYGYKMPKWVERIEQGTVYSDPKEADVALAAALKFVDDNTMVNPYLFEVRVDGGKIVPASERELIRAAGPTPRSTSRSSAVRRTPSRSSTHSHRCP